MSNSQKLQDIIVLTEAAKVMESLANCRLAIPQSVRLGTNLLDIAKRLKAEIEDDVQKKNMWIGYGVSKEVTRQEYIDGAIERESREMMIPVDSFSEKHKEEIKATAATMWDKTK